MRNLGQAHSSPGRKMFKPLSFFLTLKFERWGDDIFPLVSYFNNSFYSNFKKVLCLSLLFPTEMEVYSYRYFIFYAVIDVLWIASFFYYNQEIIYSVSFFLLSLELSELLGFSLWDLFIIPLYFHSSTLILLIFLCRVLTVETKTLFWSPYKSLTNDKTMTS